MPNWSFNYLVVEGDEIEKFQQSALPKKQRNKDEPEVIDFDNFIPYPDEQKKKDMLKYHASNLKGKTEKDKEKYYAGEGITEEMKREMMLINLESDDPVDFLGWHTVNWGTKWNACYSQVFKVDEKTLLYRFDTAWSPPIRVFEAITQMFPNLIFTMLYGEEGNFFSGYVRAKDGKAIAQQHTKYKSNWAYPVKFMKKYKLTKLINYIKD